MKIWNIVTCHFLHFRLHTALDSMTWKTTITNPMETLLARTKECGSLPQPQYQLIRVSSIVYTLLLVTLKVQVEGDLHRPVFTVEVTLGKTALKKVRSDDNLISR